MQSIVISGLNMQPNNKKEISCRVLFSLLNAVKKKNIDTDKILKGVPYDLPYLLNKHERIEWWVTCKIIANTRPYFSRQEYEQMGRDYVVDEFYIEGIIFALILYSSGKLTNLLKNQMLKAASSIVSPLFSCIHQQIHFIEKNKMHLHFYLDPGYEHCPELFYMSIGVLEKLGEKTAKKGFKVDFTLTSNGGDYDISWVEAGFSFKLKNWGRWLFNMRKAFLDLTESHDELINQYNKLEESKKLLQQQTTQLRTAHEITKSIRQSLDINKTLKAITSALVNEANFASARIKLFKDTEGNNLDIEDYSGSDEVNIEPLVRPIIINEVTAGELIIYPKSETEIYESNELLNYMIPIINISIHDSLILRTVTDYKNNLEKKVEKRTGELKIAQNEISKTVDLLQLEQQVQNRFFMNISHEFRTPLTLIIGPVKEITESSVDEKMKEKLGVVYKNANRMLGLVNQLLDISKIESHNMKLQTRPQNIIPLLRDLILSFSSYAERKKISLKLIAAEDQIVVYLDRDKMEKIITNVLSNALKFTPGRGKVDVSINQIDEPNQSRSMEITVCDTGIGIPKEKLPNIFDRFYQVDGSHTREQEGTGIGLSLTKELVEMHKGKIEVESEEGKGTKVKIRIPLGKDHLKPEEINEITEENITISAGSTDSVYYEEIKSYNPDCVTIAENGKPLLLLIEDNSDVRNYIKENLKKDYLIIEAKDGEDGWNKSTENLPDLIICDVMMPKMDGFQLCKKLKTSERTSHIPVILLTAKATMADKVNGLETGADEYITKPFETVELIARIKNLIEQRKRIHEHFRKMGIVELNQAKITPIDRRLLQNAFDIIK